MDTVGKNLDKIESFGLKDRLAAEVWLSFLLQKDRAFLFANPDYLVNKNIEQRFVSGVRDMAEGKPLAQLMGYKEFYGLDIIINENVLVPRPESELLVDIIKEFLDTHSYAGKLIVADIGTGSGCILLAILKTLGFGKGIGIDISGKALEVARLNAEKLGLADKVSWVNGNLTEGLDTPVQVMVANLPYIGKEKYNFIADNVARFEPEVALYGGSDGLELCRELFRQLTEKIWKPEILAVEFGFGQLEEMEKLLAQYFGQFKYKVVPDLAGIPRVFVVEFGSQKY